SALPTDSYLSCEYNALHTYLFEDATEKVRPGRYHLEPAAGTATISHADAGERQADYLKDDLAARLAERPARFVVTVSLAGVGDAIDDPSIAWTDHRQRITDGHIEITRLPLHRERERDVLVFDPTRITDRIALDNDPILQRLGSKTSTSPSRS